MVVVEKCFTSLNIEKYFLTFPTTVENGKSMRRKSSLNFQNY
jgi:hypothetical protein